jgi:hypothetical protein
MLTDATAALLGRGKRINLGQVAEHRRALVARFEAMPLTNQRTLIRELITVTVNPGRDLGRVDIVHQRAPWLIAEDEFAGVDH